MKYNRKELLNVYFNIVVPYFDWTCDAYRRRTLWFGTAPQFPWELDCYYYGCLLVCRWAPTNTAASQQGPGVSSATTTFAPAPSVGGPAGGSDDGLQSLFEILGLPDAAWTMGHDHDVANAFGGVLCTHHRLRRRVYGRRRRVMRRPPRQCRMTIFTDNRRAAMVQRHWPR